MKSRRREAFAGMIYSSGCGSGGGGSCDGGGGGSCDGGGGGGCGCGKIDALHDSLVCLWQE